MTRHLIYLSIPGLRPRDVADPSVAPTLHGWASAGALAELVPSFPAVTSCVQACTWTGAGPSEHGVIANGFYHRDRREVAFWVGGNGLIGGEQIWNLIAATGEFTSAVWHAQNIKDAAADYIVTPAPIHEPDGTTRPWCYSKPKQLYPGLVRDLGHFPLQHYWGPLANIESSQWIIAAAQWLITHHDPNFHYIYLPHLDYASQRFGPDSPQAVEAVRELDALLCRFQAFVASSSAGPDVVYLVVSEYAMTNVSGVVYPNIELRRHGLLRTKDTADGEVIDLAGSDAFAVVDHQCAHLYTRKDCIDRVASIFDNMEGIAGLYAGEDRRLVGLNHPRSGEVVLVARDDYWFAYYWWWNDAQAPPFARTVDIHRKPGYDPVELFIDPQLGSIPLDTSLVKGSHGAPAETKTQRAALICSRNTPLLRQEEVYRDTDVKSKVLGLLGINFPSPESDRGTVVPD